MAGDRREHGRRVYDWWSRHERLLELGCGPGEGLGRLRERVGPEGTVVGVDESYGMVRRARERRRTADWANVGSCART